MKIKSIQTYHHDFELTRPYTVAYKTQYRAENVIVEMITDNGLIGFGAAAPAPEVTNESMQQCLNALDPESLRWCKDIDFDDFQQLRAQALYRLSQTPAACAAVDIALHDLYAKHVGKPLVEVLGRVHHQLPTSITVGIKNVLETLKEACEYYARGFRVLKIKLGCNVDEDIERLIKLRENFGHEIIIRVDPNQGYTFEDLTKFISLSEHLAIEFIEQPLKVNDTKALYTLPKDHKKLIAVDESLLNESDAEKLLEPSCCGIFNIKLMKCGGIYASQKIASIANVNQIKLMWGCMDESIISITAALHTAFSSSATKYIDLDGSLDLAADIVSGGFNLKNGVMTTLDRPGLGVIKI